MASVTRSGATQRHKRRADMERKLLEATERLMGDGLAFTELSVDKLATAAGMSRATFYVYFEDKSDLLRRLMQHVLTEISEAAAIWWQRAQRHDPRDLRAAIRVIVATYRRHQTLLAAVVEASGYDAEVAAEFRGLIDRITEATKRIIELGQRDGHIREMDTDLAAGALTWMVERACYQLLNGPTTGSDEGLVATLTDLIWSALYLRPASAAGD